MKFNFAKWDLKILWTKEPLQIIFQSYPKNYLNFHFCLSIQEPLALDRGVICKIQKCHSFQGIKNSLHRGTQMGVEPHKKIFQKSFSTKIWSLEELKAFAY